MAGTLGPMFADEIGTIPRSDVGIPHSSTVPPQARRWPENHVNGVYRTPRSLAAVVLGFAAPPTIGCLTRPSFVIPQLFPDP